MEDSAIKMIVSKFDHEVSGKINASDKLRALRKQSDDKNWLKKTIEVFLLADVFTIKRDLKFIEFLRTQS